MALESDLERKIVDFVESLGGRAWKWVSPGRRGVPDRIIFLPGGIIIFAEIKKPGLKEGRSPQQIKVARILTALGARVWRVADLEEFKRDIQALFISEVR